MVNSDDNFETLRNSLTTMEQVNGCHTNQRGLKKQEIGHQILANRRIIERPFGGTNADTN